MAADNFDAGFCDEKPMSDTSSGTWKRWGIRSAIGILVAGIVCLAWLVYSGISMSLRAEKAFHATLLTTQVIEDYVRQHNGQWPRSWKELEQSSTRTGANLRWPEDQAEIEQYVCVDFDADANDLARQSADEFQAIKPIGPHYVWEDRPELSSLLETLRSTREPQEERRD